MRSNKVEYSKSAGMYCTTHDINVSFYMPDFSISKIIKHHFHVNNDKGDSGIGYDMIICRDLMLKLVLAADFKHQVLQGDSATVHMKKTVSLLGKSDLNNREMREVVMQNAEPASTREAT